SLRSGLGRLCTKCCDPCGFLATLEVVFLSGAEYENVAHTRGSQTWIWPSLPK
ncbi:hypothetical protein NDU88_001601, partial [Pleurodeles waltl]